MPASPDRQPADRVVSSPSGARRAERRRRLRLGLRRDRRRRRRRHHPAHRRGAASPTATATSTSASRDEARPRSHACAAGHASLRVAPRGRSPSRLGRGGHLERQRRQGGRRRRHLARSAPSPAEARLYAMTTSQSTTRSTRSPPLGAVRVRRAGRGGGASPDAAVAAAARDVLVPSSASSRPSCRRRASSGRRQRRGGLRRRARRDPDGPAKKRGRRRRPRRRGGHPRAAGERRSREPLVDSAYPQGTAPASTASPPSTTVRLRPRVGDVTPSCCGTARSSAPARRTRSPTPRYAADFNEIKRLGGDGVTTPSARTAEQTEIALFWVESSPLQWNRIARTRRRDGRARPVGEGAPVRPPQHEPGRRLHRDVRGRSTTYKYWRPVTAIRLAATDGNPRDRG